MNTNFLTNAQVHLLNEKHGWFQYRDAQSDVSRAFAQDAIAMHERIRAAAPELLSMAEATLSLIEDMADLIRYTDRVEALETALRAVIAKATGVAV